MHTRLNKDIDFMQDIIEDRCPSCGQIGRGADRHDTVGIGLGKKNYCIRYFISLPQYTVTQIDKKTINVSVQEQPVGLLLGPELIKWEGNFLCCHADYKYLVRQAQQWPSRKRIVIHWDDNG